MTGRQKILIVSDPGQGIINPSLRFANRLLKIGTNVTFTTSFTGINRIKNQTTAHGLTFAPFSDDHHSGKQPPTTLQQINSDFATNGVSAVTEIITTAAASGQPFDHLVYTILVPWAATVANTHGVKSTLLWCQPAIILDIYYYYFSGYEALISGCKNNPNSPINLPGLPPLTVADLPSFFWPSSPKEHDFLLQIVEDHIDILKIAPSILVNTFNELEIESIKAIEKLEFIPIGPLIPSDEQDSSDNIIKWLNTKPKSSFVYVSFGTLANLSMEQVEEISIGMLESGRPFLWVMRDSEQAGKLSKIDELKKQGMIVNWCCQMTVLSHEAIRCFVMHGGWNSTSEALAAGVSMVVIPQWSDQGTNGKMIEDVCKTGVRAKRREFDGVVEGKEIERCVKMVMGDCEMRRNAKKWRDLAREALNNGGLSTVNLQTFLSNCNCKP